MAAPASDQDVVVHGQRARAEIERILAADNLDTGELSAREVAEVMENIPRGGAPEDFWAAYQAHVRAWEELANAEDLAADDEDSASVDAAQDAIETTFDEVERIAGRYGARLPVPRAQLSTIA